MGQGAGILLSWRRGQQASQSAHPTPLTACPSPDIQKFLKQSFFFTGVFALPCSKNWASLVAQRLKHLPAMQETWVRSLGWEDPLEKEMAAHSSILVWRIPLTAEPGGLQSTGSQRKTRGKKLVYIYTNQFTFTNHIYNVNNKCKEFKESAYYVPGMMQDTFRSKQLR